MPTEINFDTLAEAASYPDAPRSDLNELYGHTFALTEWHFIARGEFPDVMPYVASRLDVADNKYMIRAFTDTQRLQRFVNENNLQQPDGSALVLTIPTVDIIDYLEGFIKDGVHGIWFNSDVTSYGYYAPLQQLRPMKTYLEEIGWTPKSE